MTNDPSLARYSRQMLFPAIGESGQRALKHARVTLIGCGALGSVIANLLVRSGVGYLRIVDRDFIEIDNLQRQVLFDEHDIAANLPKAEAAARKLRRINSGIEVEASVADVNPSNVESFCADADLILDGTDNFETRFLINDVAVKNRVPWVYGACIGAEGLVMPIVPSGAPGASAAHATPCLRCIWEDAPPPGSTPTCETAGVLAPIVDIVASLQVIEAMKLLTGKLDELNRNLVSVDAWRGTFRALNMQAAYDDGDCRCCKHNEYAYLTGDRIAATTTLCGRNAVQITPAGVSRINFQSIAARLPSGSRPTHNTFLLRFVLDDYQVTLFADGRAIIKGTADAAEARSVYARYIGS